MTDSTWIRAYNNKSIYTGGQVQAGTILSNGRMTANEFVQLNGVAIAGAACSPNGLIGRDAAGGILSCQSGVWIGSAKIKMNTVLGETTCANSTAVFAYCPAGQTAIGGSYALRGWSKGSNHNSPDSMALDPAQNRFYLTTPNNSQGQACFQAIVNCAIE